MMRPVRLQLSRTKGFRLHAASKAVNGLRAINVARPGKFGNLFVVAPTMTSGALIAERYIAATTASDAVARFRAMMAGSDERAAAIRAALSELRGKNLACWCKPGAPCHADVLLEMANR